MRTSWIATLALLASTAILAAESRTVHQQVAAEPTAVVVIKNVAGSINVQAWDKPQVAATAELHGAELGLEVSSQGGQIVVQITGYEDHSNGFGDHREALLTVQVPKMSRVTVNAVSAPIDSTGLLAEQHLQSVSGAIHAELATGDVDAKTVSGYIGLRGHGQSSHVTLSSVSGVMELTDGGGDLHATSVSGNLTAAVDATHTVSAHTTSGNITLSGSLTPGASLDANTISGHVRINERAPQGFSYDLKSFSGDINDCFGQQPQRTHEHGPGSSLSGTRGAGSATIKVNTLSGAVSICDQ
jgi:DUF4097 and DUF4098 domain-containing protein YvlB